MHEVYKVRSHRAQATYVLNAKSVVQHILLVGDMAAFAEFHRQNSSGRKLPIYFRNLSRSKTHHLTNIFNLSTSDRR